MLGLRVSLVIALMGLEWGCTVVTSCPTNQAPAQGNGGAANGGGENGGGPSNAGVGNTTAQFPAWTNATSNLAGLDSECGNMSTVAAKPDEDMLIAGIAHQGLWSSTDGGQTWSALGTAKGSDTIINRTSAIVFDPEHPATFWESGLYNDGGVYKTTNDGELIVRQGAVTHSDLVAIDFSDPMRSTLLAGGHEMARVLNLSTDGGATWKPTGSTLPDSTNCTHPLIIDSTRFLVGCGGYGGGVSGIFRSTDGGASFSAVSTLGGATAPLRASDGSIYWTGPDNAMARSTDDGETWTEATDKFTILSITPVELPDGRIAAVSQSNHGIYVSADQGSTWDVATAPLPYQDPTGFTYSAQEKAFYIYRFDCSNSVPANGIMRSDFDYEAK